MRDRGGVLAEHLDIQVLKITTSAQGEMIHEIKGDLKQKTSIGDFRLLKIKLKSLKKHKIYFCAIMEGLLI